MKTESILQKYDPAVLQMAILDRSHAPAELKADMAAAAKQAAENARLAEEKRKAQIARVLDVQPVEKPVRSEPPKSRLERLELIAAKMGYGLVPLRPNKRLQPGERIIREVCNEYMVTVAAMIGSQRSKELTTARQACYYRISAELGYSTTQIGSIMNKDHSTIIHGRRMHAQRNNLPQPWTTNHLNKSPVN